MAAQIKSRMKAQPTGAAAAKGTKLAPGASVGGQSGGGCC